MFLVWRVDTSDACMFVCVCVRVVMMMMERKEWDGSDEL